jgi:hypothetical protein
MSWKSLQDERYVRTAAEFGAALERLSRAYEVDRTCRAICSRRSILRPGRVWRDLSGAADRADNQSCAPVTAGFLGSQFQSEPRAEPLSDARVTNRCTRCERNRD